MCPICGGQLVLLKTPTHKYKQCIDCNRAWSVPFSDSLVRPELRVPV